MAGVATAIHLTEEEQSILESWMRNGTTEQRLVQRARIVLEAAARKTTKEVAALLTTRPATVSKWLVRFARERLAGLMDAPGRGRRRRYGECSGAFLSIGR